MKLTLAKNDGEVIEQWYIPDADYTEKAVKMVIEDGFAVFVNEAEY